MTFLILKHERARWAVSPRWGMPRPRAATMSPLWSPYGLRAALLVLACLGLHGLAKAQTASLQLPQSATLVNTNFALAINWQSYAGVPIPGSASDGSDGRYQFTNGPSIYPATTNQFHGFVGFSGIPVQQSTNLVANEPFVADASALGWPRAIDPSSHQVALVLRSAQVGAPYLGQSFSFFFGSVIPVPITDEHGAPLPPGTSQIYWFPAPYTNNVATPPYYWSPNAQAVFATQPGVINVTWKKFAPASAVPPDYGTNPSGYSVESGLYYTLYTANYLVSGSPVKTPEKMYWTEGSFLNTGHAVTVPSDRVSAVNVVWNTAFPERVSTPYLDPNYVPPVGGSNSYQETRTLWLDNQGQIHSYNVEGRVFVELLGALNPDGTRFFLGFELVDVYQEPTPSDVTINLGEPLMAYQDGSDDSALFPAPIQNEQNFYYEIGLRGSTRPTYYADRATVNLNNFEMYWLVTGVAGLQWPLLFDRYHLVWPADPSMYSYYLRPPAASAAEAALTAVQLPPAEAPNINYQDPLDTPRATLTPTFEFYTWLTPAYPAHRTLLRFNAGNNVAFERVFSWLDQGLETNSLFAGSVVTNLAGNGPPGIHLPRPLPGSLRHQQHRECRRSHLGPVGRTG